MHRKNNPKAYKEETERSRYLPRVRCDDGVTYQYEELDYEDIPWSMLHDPFVVPIREFRRPSLSIDGLVNSSQYRTGAPRTLTELTHGTLQAAYDPANYEDLLRQLQDMQLEAVNQQSLPITLNEDLTPAENPGQTIGTPRMQVIHDAIIQVRQAMQDGVAAANPLWSINIPETSDLDTEEIRRQLEQYWSGLQRYVAVRPMRMYSLQPLPVVNTEFTFTAREEAVNLRLREIAARLGVPWRIFTDGNPQPKPTDSEEPHGPTQEGP